jgi:probable F420-dependent oxidoreductase
MRYGVDICTLGDFAEPAQVVMFARAAEAAGWEAVFVWDHLAFAWGVPSADAWVVLAAVAQATTRVRLGPAVTPLPRRRPAVVASAVATLDQLSGGRVVLGVGAGGVPAEFAAFGERGEPLVRAGKLDEALEVIAALWAGRSVSHAGEHYTVNDVTLAPLPVQRPRVPVWVGGNSRAALRRAARWDGWIVAGDNERGEMTVAPESLADDIGYIGQNRDRDTPFEVAVIGASDGPDDPMIARYEAVGATWWLEHIHGRRASAAQLLSRIEAGPPSS